MTGSTGTITVHLNDEIADAEKVIQHKARETGQIRQGRDTCGRSLAVVRISDLSCNIPSVCPCATAEAVALIHQHRFHDSI